MRHELDVAVGPAMALQASPALIAFAELLAMPSFALEQRIERELQENPALERSGVQPCLLCWEPLDGPCGCRWDRTRAGSGSQAGWTEADDPLDPVARLPYRPTDAERLCAEARPSLSRPDHFLAEYLAGGLDGRGLLTGGVDEVAADLGVDASRVLRVLRVLQQAGPPGMAARDVRECLLLQLDRWEADHQPQPLVRSILEHHLGDLAHGRYRAISAATRRGSREVLAARDFIRSHLRPYPTADGHDGDLPRSAPDLRVLPRADRSGEFQVQIIEAERLGLGIDPLYQRLAEGAGTPTEVGRHARRHVRLAQRLLHQLDERWRTLRAVAEQAVERQREFLRHGPRGLEPLTRAEVAAALGLHESTVSRAVSGKLALLPSGRALPLAAFFDASLGPREALKHAIDAEPRPLSDGELARLLASRGHHLARRTVAKYRSQLGIPARSAR